MKCLLLSFDGGEYSVLLSSALARHAETEVNLVISEEAGGPHLEALDPTVRLTMYKRPRMRQVVSSLNFLRLIWREVQEFNPDIVHIQHHQLWLYMILLPALSRRYPTVITVHDPTHHVGDRESRRTPQGIIHGGYRRADELIVHATQSKRQMVGELRFDTEAIHVIPHIAVSNSGNPPPSVEENEKLLLFFGRIWEYKGLEYLIKAEPLIAKKVPGVKIMIAGQGEDLGRYRAMMQNPNSFIVHNEMVPWDTAARYFTQSSVVVLPYIDASSSGVVPVAYAFEKPVVGTDVGGLPDIIEDGKTGYLVPPRDPQAIADAVIKLIENPDKRHEMGRRGKQKLLDECGPEVVARKTAEVYQKALGARR